MAQVAPETLLSSERKGDADPETGGHGMGDMCHNGATWSDL